MTAPHLPRSEAAYRVALLELLVCDSDPGRRNVASDIRVEELLVVARIVRLISAWLDALRALRCGFVSCGARWEPGRATFTDIAHGETVAVACPGAIAGALRTGRQATAKAMLARGTLVNSADYNLASLLRRWRGNLGAIHLQ